MQLPTRGDVASHVAAIQRCEIALGAIPRICRQFSCLSARVAFDVRQHRLELVCVAGLVRQPLRHDHLVIGIDGRLSVIALDESACVFMMRLSGSVKLRCARSGGVPGGCVAGRPRREQSDG